MAHADAAVRGVQIARPATGYPVRPSLAASLLLLDRSAAQVRVLVGRRNKRHAFMPDVHVFPGGRRDPGDHRLSFHSDLAPPLLARLCAVYKGRLSVDAVRALPLAALRELYEETGLMVGPCASGFLPFLPDLEKLRYIARAITPPGHVRRYDTHFFALFLDETRLDLDQMKDSDELEDLRFVPVEDPSEVSLPEITARILVALQSRLDADPLLGFDASVPFFHVRHGRAIRDLL